jgi:hypothetical protein
MALGRVFGPLLGGMFIGAGAYGWLGVTSAGILVFAASTLLLVDRQRFIIDRKRLQFRR